MTRSSLRPVRLLAAFAVLSGCIPTGEGGGRGPTDPGGGGNQPPLQQVAISLSASTASVSAGQSHQLTATVTGTTDTRVNWSSSATGVATVSSSGLVVGVGAGTAVITAQSAADPTKAATATITVSATGPGPGGGSGSTLVSGVPVSNLGSAVGGRLHYRINVPAGTTQLVLQTTGGTGDLDMYVRGGTAADTARADCASGGDNTAERCVINSPTPGEWWVMLHAYAAFSGVTLSASTSTAPVTGFILKTSATQVTLSQGTSASIQLNITRLGGFNDPITLGVVSGGAGLTTTAAPAPIPAGGTSSTLMLSAATSATVRSRGFWIIATSGAEKQTVVIPLTLLPSGQGGVAVTVSPGTASIAVGGTQQLTATVTGASNTAVLWSTSNAAVATVSTTGLVQGISNGTATITATSVADGSVRSTATINVGSTSGGGSGTLITSGVAIAGLSGAEDSERLYRITVPAGATRLEVRTSGGSGDLDMYMRYGAPPTSQAVNCNSSGADNNEFCGFTNPTAGDWYILLVGYEAYSGVTLLATVTRP